MANKTAVMGMLDCSTGHIDAADDLELRWLAAQGGGVGLRVVPHEYGYFLCPTAGDGAEAQVARQQHRLSPAFWSVIDEAQRLGCRWVNLDRDGEELSGLPKFDW